MYRFAFDLTSRCVCMINNPNNMNDEENCLTILILFSLATNNNIIDSRNFPNVYK